MNDDHTPPARDTDRPRRALPDSPARDCRILVVGDTLAGRTLARTLRATGRAVTLCDAPPEPADGPSAEPRSNRPAAPSGTEWPDVPASVRREATPEAVDGNELAVRVRFADGETGYYDLVVVTTGRVPLDAAGPRVVTAGDGRTPPDVTAALADTAILAAALAGGAAVPESVERVRRRQDRPTTTRRRR